MSQPHNSEDDAVIEQLKALGYIDPGAGSSVWQMFLARLLKTWNGLTSFFRGTEKEDD